MVTSSTSIANLALARLGQTRITSISDTTLKEAVWSNELYPTARDYVTEAYLWRHAKTVATLVETTNDRSDDFAYAYTRPSACLSFRYLMASTGGFDPQDPIRFECNGTKIYSDEPDARGVYTAQTTDVTTYPPSFVDAVSFYLAHLLVGPLRLENKLLTDMMQAYKNAVSYAIAIGAIEQVYIKDADEAAPDWIAGR